jgi:hypothetical protein
MACCSSLPSTAAAMHRHLPGLAAMGLFSLPTSDDIPHRAASVFRPVVLYAEQGSIPAISLPALSALAAASPPVPLKPSASYAARSLATLESVASKELKFTQVQDPKTGRRRRSARVAWSDDEKMRFRLAISKHDRCWKKVAEEMKTRSSAQVYAYARWYFSKHPEERPPPSALARSPAARALPASAPANTRVASRASAASPSNLPSPTSSAASGLSSPLSSPASSPPSRVSLQ